MNTLRHNRDAAATREDPLDRSTPPTSLREAVEYVDAYFGDLTPSGFPQFADGRLCFMTESLTAFREWLGSAMPDSVPPAVQPRGEGWSL